MHRSWAYRPATFTCFSVEGCAQCGKRGDTSTLRCCSRCKAIRYCSLDCQARDWTQHKVTCTPTANSPSSSAITETDEKHTTTSARSEEPSTNQDQETLGVNLPRTSIPEPWQQARSMALEAFPGNRIVDRFEDIDKEGMNGWTPTVFVLLMPLTSPVPVRVDGITKEVVVMKLVSPIFNPLRRGWVVEDFIGHAAHVTFGTPESPAPYFRYEDLQLGHFLCVKHADVTLFPSGVHFVRVRDASAVRVFRGSALY